jgi:hypothetical protein
MLHNLLEKQGIKFEELNPAERETFQQWQKALAQNQLTVEGIKDYLKSLIEAVEKDLTDLKESTSLFTALFNWKRDFYLKARLKNYLMMYDFITAPDRAQKQIEQSIKNIK